MSNQNDRKVIAEMMAVPDYLKPQYFAENADRIIDNAIYWNVLGSLWKLGGTVVQQELWRGLFLCGRKQGHKIMKGRERKAWRRLPKTFTAYRAINNTDEIECAISWSLSRNTVERVFSENGQRKIVSREFKKDDVFAFFDRRGEDEVLVNL